MLAQDSVGDAESSGANGPTLTVAIPTYNRGRSILPLLQALAEQLTPADELLLLDDGSADETAETAAKVPSCRYLRNPTNVGMVRNWNLCLTEARREWICVIHDDDFIEPQGIANLRRGCAALARPGVVLNDPQAAAGGAFRYRILEPGPAAVLYFPIVPSGAVVHRDVVADVGTFGEEFPFSADLEYFPRACTKFPLIVIESPKIVSYNMHDSNYQLQTWRTPHFFAQLAAIEDSVMRYAGLGDAAQKSVRNERMVAYLRHMHRAAERVGDGDLMSSIAQRMFYQRRIGIRTRLRLLRTVARGSILDAAGLVTGKLLNRQQAPGSEKSA
jgi:glycosyltransferase involved in cell wall biosynthesis